MRRYYLVYSEEKKDLSSASRAKEMLDIIKTNLDSDFGNSEVVPVSEQEFSIHRNEGL